MQKNQVMSKMVLPDNAHCKVTYHRQQDMVTLEIGATSLKLAAGNFMRMNEMMRKAAARLAMQTVLPV